MKKLVLTLFAALALATSGAWAGGGHGGHRHGGPALHGGHGFQKHHGHGFHGHHGLNAHRGFHGHKFHGHHGFHRHHHKFHSHFGFGVIVAPYWPPVYYAPPLYSPPAVVYADPYPAHYWYYCPAAQAYYPYVSDCPSGWLQVVPRGPGR